MAANPTDLLTPDIAAQEAQAQRRLAFAQMLMQDSRRPSGGTKMAGSHAILNSPLESLSNSLNGALGAYLAAKEGDKLVDLGKQRNQSLAGILTGQSGPVGMSEAPEPTPAPNSPEPSMFGQRGDDGGMQPMTAPPEPQPVMAAAPQRPMIGPGTPDAVDAGPPMAMDAPPVAPMAPGPQASPQALAAAVRGPMPGGGAPQQAPMNGAGGPGFGPANMPANQRLLAYSMSPEGYIKATMDQYSQTPEMKNFAAAYGVNSPEYREAMMAYARKAVNVSPTVVGAGSTALDQNNRPIFTAPNNDGRTINWGPNGPTASNIPGAAQANADFKSREAGAVTAATEAERAALDLIDVYDPVSKQMVKVPRLQAARGNATGAPGGGPGGVAPGGALISKPNESNEAYDKDIATKAAETYTNMQSAGSAAGGQIARLRQIDKLLDDHDGGRLSQNSMELASTLNSMGIKWDKNLGNKEAAQTLSREMALQLRSSPDGGMPGAMSEGDRKFLESLPPGIEQSKEGRKQIVNMRVQILERQQEVARLAREWQKNLGRIDAVDAKGRSFQDQLKRYTDARPLFSPKQ